MPELLAKHRLDIGEEAALAHALALLIVAAFRDGRVTQETAKTALRDLPARGRFHVKDTLIAQALAALEE